MGFLERLSAWWRRRSAAPVDASTGGAPEAERDDVSDEEAIAVVPIEESIDLHHFAPRDILSVVDEYLREARRAGFRDVRVIHGKGKGVQRRRVQMLLEKHPHVVGFRSDGLGSTLVELRASKRKRRA